MAAADACALNEGAREILSALVTRGIRTALLTRNSRSCADRVLARHGLELDFVATRENLPHKPNPDSILNISRRFGFGPRQTLMVGDYLYDVQAAGAAGVDSALLCRKGDWPPFAHLATHRIRGLMDILAIVENGDAA
jgi:phosphoglycolate phosphatase-like HAD superfamily hydrolase